MAAVLLFLAEHFELVEAIIEAIANGASKESVLKAIKASMVEASNERMKTELGG